ncbi:carbon monoxide dehydrogenase [[Phormidium ambiguum] IAM M-71]|uniref:Carbon monoxide dehydrogenase n=1 Tax=[Phormidium ambiguum] IAM M-71 TaxID=454136 RepID=A0A1U7INQ2_9CYAN|nr:molybdopterin-dependent oxidoreductase [Phormidium ambiguum]OKH38984.1 carbon monoxide dehydrogenase [Phormidium ambiguum IAM M-71]
MSLKFKINNQNYNITCPPGTSLLTLLRQQGWMGVHKVCETGDCGSCTVWINETPVHSCIYPAHRINNSQITTIEGLAKDGKLCSMQQAFIEEQGFQCGYCTPGMIMSAEKLDFSTEAELRAAMDGNLCRCTGYQAIIESIKQGKNLTNYPTTNYPLPTTQIGQNIPKQDGYEIVTGKPIYTADWTPEGTLHLKVLRSPHPHARIRKIDTSKAKKLPGVIAIFTHEDVSRIPYSTAGHAEPVPDPHDHYLLDNKVRFIGDRIAAVVAETPAIAEIACQLITVDYEILPHVIDPILAMGDKVKEMGTGDWGLGIGELTKPPIPIIHDEAESYQIHDAQHNISGEVLIEKGDLAKGFSEADLILENTYTLPAVQHTHLEPHISTSWLEEDGTLVVRSSTQVPFHCQRILAQLFNLPQDKVRVYKTNIGGGFGNKQEILTEDLCVLATLKTNRPVQWVFTRNEEFTATNSRHAMKVHLKIGVKKDGSLTAVEMNAIANTGAYGNHGTQVVFLTGTMPLGLYRCPNQKFHGLSVYTNTMPAGAFRGYGATQGFFAIECLLDEIAEKLQLDPLEFRRKNLINTEDSLLLGVEKHFKIVGSCGLDEALTKVAEVLEYQPGTPPKINGHLRQGVGFAVAMQGSGLAKIHTAKVKIALKENGRYELRTGAVDVGTGAETTLRQIAAEVLNTTFDRIDIIAGDTKETPFDAGSYASATTYITGQAVILAAQKLRELLLNNVSEIWQTLPENLELSGILIKLKISQTSKEIDLVTLAKISNPPLVAESEYAADRSTLTFAVQGVEVEVDTETGRTKILRCVQAVDIGKAINPRICEGQVIGGIVMGLGYALTEELHFDEQGKIINPNLRTYRLPLAKDVPPIEVFLIEKSDPYGPFGAKGVGEVVINCTAPAIVNAVAHATGIRLKQLPITPERLWKAIQGLHNRV